jgi:hypothetical protein
VLLCGYYYIKFTVNERFTTFLMTATLLRQGVLSMLSLLPAVGRSCLAAYLKCYLFHGSILGRKTFGCSGPILAAHGLLNLKKKKLKFKLSLLRMKDI